MKSNSWKAAIALAVGAALFAGRTVAADITFTAEFKPSVGNPTHNRFINTTPQSGYCASFPEHCPNGQFSVALPIGQVQFDLEADRGGREAAHIKLPSQFVQVQVVNDRTGASEILNFRVSSFSTAYRLNTPVTTITGAENPQAGHRSLWHGSSWVNAPAPCSGTGMGYLSDLHYTFLWNFPVGPGACIKIPKFDLPQSEHGFRFDGPNTSIGYELVTPNPLKMSSGTYRGEHTFTIGPGGDFDFGDRATVEKSSIVIGLELFVHHQIELHLPPGSDRAVLEPSGGWGAWVNSGRRPTKIFRDVPFSFTTSTPFSVKLTCPDGAPQNGRCLIRSTEQNASAPLDVALTMSRMRTESGQPVTRLPLVADQQTRIEPEGYVLMGDSRLHIEVGEQGVADMVKHPGAKYRGTITVVFDSEPEG
ncbi:hypothetical protein [Bordetella genomosp. 9]|nr:hypothetical protein [Bordetella genomosp. 9]